MMRFFRTLVAIFWLPTLVLILQYCRQWFYYGHSEIDPIAHFFGGFAIAYGALITFRALYSKLILPSELLALLLVTFSLSIGVTWEWYEYVRFHDNPALAHWNWWPDTLFDLLMDMLGAIFFACAAILRKKI